MEILKDKDVEGIICTPVKNEEVLDLLQKAEEMIELCKKEDGIGLAAPQVGILKNMFIRKNLRNQSFDIIFNPSFFKEGGTTNTVEGCLSYPETHFYLKRFKRIGTIYYVWNGTELIKRNEKLIGIPSFVFQHETDHLKGITVNMKGSVIDDDKLKKRTNQAGEEMKIPNI